MEERRQMPLIGDRFPEMKVETNLGTLNLPGDYKGKWFLLFSHPGDFTPVCTTEFYSFQKNYDKFRELNTELIGLSVDQVHSHLKWTEWIEDNMGEKIEFPIIADPMGDVAGKLGLIHSANTSATVRAVFIVDPEGIIRAILYYPSELGRNVDEFLRMMRGFRKSGEEKVAIPANWPENELIGDGVIIPPAGSEAAIKDRRERKERGEIECYDWWFCYKKA